MPFTRVIYFKESTGCVLVLDWLDELQRTNRQAWKKCSARILQLRSGGYDLRRPVVDFLRDGIMELRMRQGNVQLRLLYFFTGQNIAVISHGFVKHGGQVPEQEIEKAIRNRSKFRLNPELHTYEE